MEEGINNEIELKQLENFLGEELGLQVGPRFDRPLIGTNYKVDCSLVIKMGKFEIPFFVIVQGEVNSLKQIQKFEELVKPLYGIGLLVADSIEISCLFPISI